MKVTLHKYFPKFVAAVAMLVCSYAAAMSQTPGRAPQWDVVSVSDTQPSSSGQASPELEIEVRDEGVVLISTDRPANIKVFSILGQLITQKNVAAGTVRLRMGARGIYILKAGTTTRRISL